MDEADPHEPAGLLQPEILTHVERVEVAGAGDDSLRQEGVVERPGGREGVRAQAEGRGAAGSGFRAVQSQTGNVLYACGATRGNKTEYKASVRAFSFIPSKNVRLIFSSWFWMTLNASTSFSLVVALTFAFPNLARE